jgi:hypothetical protein
VVLSARTTALATSGTGLDRSSRKTVLSEVDHTALGPVLMLIGPEPMFEPTPTAIIAF